VRPSQLKCGIVCIKLKYRLGICILLIYKEIERDARSRSRQNMHENSWSRNGKKCVIVDVMDKSLRAHNWTKTITGVKRKRVNLNHIMPLDDKIDLKRGALDDEVTSALTTSGKLER